MDLSPKRRSSWTRAAFPSGIGRRVAMGTAAASAVVALFLAGLAGPKAEASSPKPRRIVSLNLCTDQLLLTLGIRSRIASLTFLAADPSASAMAEAARGFPTNRGRAEEVLALNPDLILAGSTAATPTVQLLKRLGHRVVVVPHANTLADIPRNIRTVAKAVG